jgi:hypothetical protein
MWLALVFKPVVRGAMLAAQVMTDGERNYYAALFGVPLHRFTYIPLPFDISGLHISEERREDFVFSFGRTACDWGTLFPLRFLLLGPSLLPARKKTCGA